jgi:hypothetical protein
VKPAQRIDFLLELERSGSRSFACAAAKVSLREATAERDRDPLFERAWRQAERSARVAFEDAQQVTRALWW